MSISLYLAFVAAATLLAVTPGPNVAMIVGNSVAWGTRFGLLTVAGTSTAVVLQLVLTGLGMTALLGSVGLWFNWLRWIGAAYLIFIGVRQFVAEPVDLTLVRAQRRSARAIWARGFLVSLTNPKILLFYGAFFPQFIAPEAPMGPQVALLAATFLTVAVLIDCGWAFAAGRARGVLASRGRLRNRISGGCLIGAGLALTAVRRS